MVVCIEGKVDGNDVIFSKKEGDLWEAIVPFNVDGTYIMELTAYDEFGNTGHITKVLITFHPENQCIKIDPFPWKGLLEEPKIKTEVYASNYCATLLGR